MSWFGGQRQRELVQLRAENQRLRSRVIELESHSEQQGIHVTELEAKIARLEAELAAARKHSGNSSKPPSSDIVKPPRKARGKTGRRKIGGQPGHPRHERPAFAPGQVDDRQHYGAGACQNCGGRNLQPLPDPAQVLQQVELVLKPFRVTEHVVQACLCRDCQQVSTGELPAAITRTGLIGPRMMAFLLFMKGAMRCSYSAIEELLDHVLGFKVSRGYLAKVMMRGSRVLAGPVEELRGLLPSQPCLNVDETGHKDNGKGMWTWCFRAPRFVLFSIQASRGSEVLLEMLGREFNGVLGCDYFSAYRKFMGQMSGTVQFCFAHLIRDLKFLSEHPDPVLQVYGEPILRAVGRMFHLIHEQVHCPVPDFQSQLERLKNRILQLADTKRLSPVPGFVEEQYSEAFNMAERFRNHGDAYFTFITTPQIGPTNNAAEQALRFVVMDRRATQGTRSHKGRLFCERIWTVVGTCRMNKRSIFDYLCEAMTAWSLGAAAPSLLPSNSS